MVDGSKRGFHGPLIYLKVGEDSLQVEFSFRFQQTIPTSVPIPSAERCPDVRREPAKVRVAVRFVVCGVSP